MDPGWTLNSEKPSKTMDFSYGFVRIVDKPLEIQRFSPPADPRIAILPRVWRAPKSTPKPTTLFSKVGTRVPTGSIILKPSLAMNGKGVSRK